MPGARPPRSYSQIHFTLQSTPPPRARPRRHSAPLLRTSPQRSGLAETGTRSPTEPPMVVEVPGGGERDRTDDLLLAKQALSQLSYTPVSRDRRPEHKDRIVFRSLASGLCDLAMVGQGGFEPPTSRLSSARSNQLSY